MAIGQHVRRVLAERDAAARALSADGEGAAAGDSGDVGNAVGLDLTAEYLELERRRMALMERQLALQEQQAQSLSTQVERTAPKENPHYIDRGIFNKPNGEPWATDLRCDVFFGPMKLNRTPLTEAEVAALNQIQPLARAHITKVEGTVVYGSVQPTRDAQGRLSRLEILFPMGKDDNPQHFPTITTYAKELAAQAEPVHA